jgi:hypothetical protein
MRGLAWRSGVVAGESKEVKLGKLGRGVTAFGFSLGAGTDRH